jgi:Gnt-I system high-affinity gluconate transporter
MSILIVIACILLLVVLVTYVKINPFIAFLLVSLLAGYLLQIPIIDLAKAVQKGMGDTLGSLVAVIILGAMLGKLVAQTGAAQQISSYLIKLFGQKNLAWGLMVTGFVIGIPLFYNVGFVLMVPLIFTIANQYKINPIYTGIPMMASMSVAHGFLPPHPSPAALVGQFNANMGTTLLYGTIIAVPAIILAGPVFATRFKYFVVKDSDMFKLEKMEESQLPSVAASFVAALSPVVLLIVTTIFEFQITKADPLFPIIKFVADPSIVMLFAIIIATFAIGISKTRNMEKVMGIYTDSVKEVGMILLIIAGAGALKEILLVSGVSKEIAMKLQTLPFPPLVLGWLMAAIIRVSVGSATIAGLTAAGMIYPIIETAHIDPNLMVLSIGAGSLMFSHINDSGFWLFKEYFNLSVGETIKTWSTMESIVSFVGLIGVLVLEKILY